VSTIFVAMCSSVGYMLQLQEPASPERAAP
jgi:hypothetical protein